MKVFLSWSGNRSKSVAETLRNWLPKVIQAAKPWMSDSDIAAGKRWSAQISNELEDTKVGIVCVTPENQLRISANVTARSGDRDRFAHRSGAGVGYSDRAVTIRQICLGLSHGFSS